MDRDKKIFNLAKKGFTDSQISKHLKISLSVVSQKTRLYWETKMNQKHGHLQ